VQDACATRVAEQAKQVLATLCTTGAAAASAQRPWRAAGRLRRCARPPKAHTRGPDILALRLTAGAQNPTSRTQRPAAHGGSK